MPDGAPRIFLFHATPVAMEPVQGAMRALWPEAEAVNILDESLSIDRAREVGGLSQGLVCRFTALGKQAVAGGADGILITCSAFGPAIRQLASQVTVPVLMPNEAMFRDALTRGGRIGMVATFAPAVSTMESEFAAFAAEMDRSARLETVLAEGAIESLRRGDREDHDRRVAQAARDLVDCDAIMLAHFSTTRAAQAVRRAVNIPVLTAPEAAVSRLRALIEGSERC
ncbi:aspartate/glutamate racemase family protein [Rhizobium sp. TRM96647]|uniref:aspartate/glutamate racemase family protein n=1 Tax=unclassified Rhizobium TaxID=2613769 RepID=UPI0021E6EA64|nr:MULTISPECIES: aspartate/glutamate racemase family protein [unclassified Rhizobium]MCV3738852.1 aspartate/glutamate racemase family protein [Rhizobium sp. TRM96647]MCV3760441.1 aspartate/glutamate racemase family protein [Rhizobium sp. TRM96650]